MAIFLYQLGGFHDANPTLPNNQTSRLNAPTITPPYAPPVARSAHDLPTYKNIPSREPVNITELTFTDPALKNIKVGDIIFTHFYVPFQAIMGLFVLVDNPASSSGFTFDIVKVPSTYNRDKEIVLDEANKVVLASNLNGNQFGEIVRKRAFIEDGLNKDHKPDVDMGYSEEVGGQIGIEIKGLPENFDICSQSPSLFITIIIEEPCYRKFLVGKGRGTGACGRAPLPPLQEEPEV